MYNFNVVCTGDFKNIFLKRVCNVPVFVLQAQPYNLEFGDEIWVKIAAQNAYGNSPYSSYGEGASVKMAPDAPKNLSTDVSLNSDS